MNSRGKHHHFFFSIILTLNVLALIPEGKDGGMLLPQ